MNKNDIEVVPVIFRVWTDEKIGALFPTISAGVNPLYCAAYYAGRHSSANYLHCIRQTRSATEAEYADLYREIAKPGYHMRVVQRASCAMHIKRLRETEQ